VEQTIPRCVNHPDVETRLSCSNCGDPICTRCMRQGAVGQKCPRCAKVPRSARGIGKPRHYAAGIGIGLAAALVGGVGGNLLLRALPFAGIIVPALLGFAIGRAVGWGVQRQSTQPFVIMAAVAGALGGLIAYGLVITGPFSLLGVALTSYVAVLGLRR